jgi:protein FRG1
MVKPLTFKGDKKAKKRKREAEPEVAPPPPANDEANDDTWVSADAVTDVAGPVLLVLPTSPPTTLACDANGSVFAMAVENMVDDNPSSAEPHDVRQVWVASRVGTEFQFKGHHGR